MPKPKRKHPGFNSIDLSLQGRQFLHFLSTRSARGSAGGARQHAGPLHVFEVRGGRDHVTLVAAPDQVVDGVIVGRMAFRHVILELPLVAQVEIVTHRIDPWI